MATRCTWAVAFIVVANGASSATTLGNSFVSPAMASVLFLEAPHGSDH